MIFFRQDRTVAQVHVPSSGTILGCYYYIIGSHGSDFAMTCENSCKYSYLLFPSPTCWRLIGLVPLLYLYLLSWDFVSFVLICIERTGDKWVDINLVSNGGEIEKMCYCAYVVGKVTLTLKRSYVSFSEFFLEKWEDSLSDTWNFLWCFCSAILFVSLKFLYEIAWSGLEEGEKVWEEVDGRKEDRKDH